MAKPKIFFDMDNVLVDTLSVLNAVDMSKKKVEKPDLIPGIFRNLDPMPNAIESVKTLAQYYDTYVLSTAPWGNPSSWQDKIYWLQQYFGDGKENPFYKKVVMAHDKSLLRGQGGILVDDRPYHGASLWDDVTVDSQWLQFGYHPEFAWDKDLTAILVQTAKKFSNSNALRDSLYQILTKRNLNEHGDKDLFVKAPWE
jgi:5'(3')-deoxyribonucleotidase